MIFRTDDLRIEALRPLLPPAILMEELPLGEASSATVAHGREQVERVLRKQDDRLARRGRPVLDPRSRSRASSTPRACSSSRASSATTCSS